MAQPVLTIGKPKVLQFLVLKPIFGTPWTIHKNWIEDMKKYRTSIYVHVDEG